MSSTRLCCLPTCEAGATVVCLRLALRHRKQPGVQSFSEGRPRRELSPVVPCFSPQSDPSPADFPGPAWVSDHPSDASHSGVMSGRSAQPRSWGLGWGGAGAALELAGAQAVWPAGPTAPWLADCWTVHLTLKTQDELACLERKRNKTPSVLSPRICLS